MENQLIQIETRLIDLDGSIEHINDGVRHLGEALATAQTDETVEALLEDIDDDDVERFLFDDAAVDLSIGAIRSDPGFNLFDDWRMDVEPDLDEILAGIPEPEAPLAISSETIKVRRRLKSEIICHSVIQEAVSTAYLVSSIV